MVTWQTPRPNGGPAVTNYVIHRYVGDTWAGASDIVPAAGLHNSYHWAGLSNGEATRFEVHAQNTGGWSAGAPTAPVTPTGSPPPYPPRTPAVVAAVGSGLVSWQAPATGPSPASYLVQVYEVGGGFVSQTETLTGADTATVVSGLEDNRTYVAAIFSVNAQGFSGAVVTDEFSPALGDLLAATNVAAARGDTQIDVTWTAPVAAVPGVTSYTATAYRAGDDTQVGSATTTNTSATITGLQNGTAVYVRVVATNLLLDGPPSAPSNTVVPAGDPFPPEDVQSERGNTELHVTWSPPSERPDGTPGDNGDPITSYEITVFRADDDQPVSATTAASLENVITATTRPTLWFR